MAGFLSPSPSLPHRTKVTADRGSKSPASLRRPVSPLGTPAPRGVSSEAYGVVGAAGTTVCDLPRFGFLSLMPWEAVMSFEKKSGMQTRPSENKEGRNGKRKEIPIVFTRSLSQPSGARGRPALRWCQPAPPTHTVASVAADPSWAHLPGHLEAGVMGTVPRGKRLVYRIFLSARCYVLSRLLRHRDLCTHRKGLDRVSGSPRGWVSRNPKKLPETSGINQMTGSARDGLVSGSPFR